MMNIPFDYSVFSPDQPPEKQIAGAVELYRLAKERLTTPEDVREYLTGVISNSGKTNLETAKALSAALSVTDALSGKQPADPEKVFASFEAMSDNELQLEIERLISSLDSRLGPVFLRDLKKLAENPPVTEEEYLDFTEAPDGIPDLLNGDEEIAAAIVKMYEESPLSRQEGALPWLFALDVLAQMETAQAAARDHISWENNSASEDFPEDETSFIARFFAGLIAAIIVMSILVLLVAVLILIINWSLELHLALQISAFIFYYILAAAGLTLGFAAGAEVYNRVLDFLKELPEETSDNVSASWSILDDDNAYNWLT